MKHEHLIAFWSCNCGNLIALWYIEYVLNMFSLWVVYVMDLNLYICKYVLEQVMYFKLDLRCWYLKFKVGILCIFQLSFINWSLKNFPWIFFFRKQGNASSRPWHCISRSWEVLHEQSSVRLDSARQSGLLTVSYHDRDIMPHDRDHAHDQPSRSWQLVRQILGCSRPFITIVTMLLSARDLQKFLDF